MLNLHGLEELSMVQYLPVQPSGHLHILQFLGSLYPSFLHFDHFKPPVHFPENPYGIKDKQCTSPDRTL